MSRTLRIHFVKNCIPFSAISKRRSYLLPLLENRFESSVIAEDPLKRTLGPEPAQGLRLVHDLPRKPQHFGRPTKTASFMNASAACLGRQLHIPAINCDSHGLLTYQMQHGPFSATSDDRTVCEELDCILPHRSDSLPGISVSRDEDDWNCIPLTSAYSAYIRRHGDPHGPTWNTEAGLIHIANWSDNRELHPMMAMGATTIGA
jgi:hypothetical protein